MQMCELEELRKNTENLKCVKKTKQNSAVDYHLTSDSKHSSMSISATYQQNCSVKSI